MCSVQRYLQKNACQSDGISRQNPLWSKEPHGSLVLLESITHLCVFRELICIYIFVIIWCIISVIYITECVLHNQHQFCTCVPILQ